MTIDEAKTYISQASTLFGFIYDNVQGGIDPWGHTDTQSVEYVLFYGDYSISIFDDVDKVVNTPFICGKTLAEMIDKIEVTEY